jgi:hypothetical protein
MDRLFYQVLEDTCSGDEIIPHYHHYHYHYQLHFADELELEHVNLWFLMILSQLIIQTYQLVIIFVYFIFPRENQDLFLEAAGQGDVHIVPDFNDLHFGETGNLIAMVNDGGGTRAPAAVEVPLIVVELVNDF